MSEHGPSDAGPGTAARPQRPPGVAFVTTHWTPVLSAGRAGTDESRRALETPCGQYWYPLYAFVRQQGYSADDAGELTQEFFLRLLAKNGFATAAHRLRRRYRELLRAEIAQTVLGPGEVDDEIRHLFAALA